MKSNTTTVARPASSKETFSLSLSLSLFLVSPLKVHFIVHFSVSLSDNASLSRIGKKQPPPECEIPRSDPFFLFFSGKNVLSQESMGVFQNIAIDTFGCVLPPSQQRKLFHVWKSASRISVLLQLIVS